MTTNALIADLRASCHRRRMPTVDRSSSNEPRGNRTLSFIGIAALLFMVTAFAPPPSGMTPKNAVERLVLAASESASRDLEVMLLQMPDMRARDSALIEAGFRRLPPRNECSNYGYSRQFSKNLVRGASVILCESNKAYVLRTDETPGPRVAPKSGELSVIAPSAPKPPPPLIVSPQIATMMPTCETDPCGRIDGERVIMVGWLVSADEEVLRRVQESLRAEHWQVPAPWKADSGWRLRIYTSGRSFEDATAVGHRLSKSEFGPVVATAMTLPIQTHSR